MPTHQTPDTGCPEAVRVEITRYAGLLADWLKRRGVDPVNVHASNLLDEASDELGRLSQSLAEHDREQSRLPVSEREPLTWPDLDERWREAAKFARATGAARELGL